MERFAPTFILLMLAAGGGPWWNARAQTVPEGFEIEVISNQLGRDPIGFSLVPDGRILVLYHQDGGLRLLVNGALRADPLLTFPEQVKTSEQGLLGLALDPAFPDSNYVYIFHSVADSTSRVTRFKLEGDLEDSGSDDLRIDPESAHDILILPDSSRFHNGGTLRFGADRKLFVSHGDDTRIDRLQDLASPYGKIFRINPDGSAPSDNPSFPDEPEDLRRDLYAIGLRNPFRFAVDPLTDELFIGDVGTDLHEELNLASGGENFGYPRFEGSVFFREEAPLIGPEVTTPIYSYPHGSPGRSVIALAVYRQPETAGPARFPDEFDGAYFYGDFFDASLRYLRDDGEGRWESVVFGTGFRGLVDAAQAPDGSFYVLEYGRVSAPDGRLSRITYHRDAVATSRAEEPANLSLDATYPNPFSGQTTLRYSLSRVANVRIEVFDLVGRRVLLSADVTSAPGTHEVPIDLADHPAGLYFLRLHAAGQITTRSIVLVP